MNQSLGNTLRGYGHTLSTAGKLLLLRQIAPRKLAGLPVNLLARRLHRPPPFLPPVLQLDISGRCNLTCPGCLTGMGFEKDRQGLMPYELFTSLIDDVGRFTALAVLYNSGEPLLHPRAVRDHR